MGNTILSAEQVNSILEQAWYLAEPNRADVPIHTLKRTDWNALAVAMQTTFDPFNQTIVESTRKQSDRLLSPTGDAICDLVGKAATKRVRSIYLVALYVLLKEKRLSKPEENYLEEFAKYRAYFLTKYIQEYGLLKANLIPIQYAEVGNNVPTAPTTMYDTPTGEKFLGTLPNEYSVKPKKSYVLRYLLAISSLLVLGLGALWFTRSGSQPAVHQETDNEAIKFSIVGFTNQKNAPCEISFAYDISGLPYEEASISFADDGVSNPIILDKPKGIIKQSFTYPHGRYVTLHVDDVYKKFHVIINSDKWLLQLGELPLTPIRKNGFLHYPVDNVPASILEKGEYYLYYQMLRDFGIDADNVVFETRVKNPQQQGGTPCFDVSIDLNGRVKHKLGVLSFNILGEHCDGFAKIRVGDLILPTEANPAKLTKSTTDLADWVVIKATTHNHVLTIYVDDEVRYSIPYTGSVGDLKFIQIGFRGTGSIDWVKLSKPDGTLLYRDDFD